MELCLFLTIKRSMEFPSISELIVHPILDTEYVLEEIDQWLPRLHAVVIGKSETT